MIKLALAASFVAALSSPVFAQTVIETPTSTTIIVPPGAPGVVSRQTNSTGDDNAFSYSPTGRAQDEINSDSAAAGNEGQPERVGSIGSGGGSGGGGGR